MSLNKLNIGSDNNLRDGWYNIDEFNIKPGTIKMNALKLEFPDNFFDEICARDVLEHITHTRTDEALKEWYRVLKPEGKIYIQTPNLKGWALALVHHKCSDEHVALHLYAHQDNPGNYHYAGFTDNILRTKCETIGFKNIEAIDEDRKTKKTAEDTNLHYWMTK